MADNLKQENISSQTPTVSSPKQQPFLTDRKQLLDPKVLEQFKGIVDKIIEDDDIQQALLARYLLEEMLIKPFPQFENEAPELFYNYQQLMILLKFVTLSSRDFSEIESLVKIHLIEAIKAKIPVHRKFQDVLNVYNDLREEGTVAEALAKMMLKSEKRIGQGLLKVGEKDQMPTIMNWLADYDRNTRTTPGVSQKRGAVERLAYTNQNKAFAQLSQDDKKLLLNVFEIYDWLKYGTVSEIPTKTALHPQAPFLKVPQPPTPPRPPVALALRSMVAPPPSGLSINKLKSELKQSSPALSNLEKKYISPVAAPVISKPLLTPDEIKREVRTPELPAYPTPHQPSGTASSAPPPRNDRPAPAAVDDIKFVDDLKKISVQHLRRGNLAMEVQKIKTKIAYLAAVNRLFPHEVVAVFEQSPLFKLYLKIGGMLIADRNPDRRAAFEGVTAKLKQEKHETLSLPEFESVADLKKEIERM